MESSNNTIVTEPWHVSGTNVCPVSITLKHADSCPCLACQTKVPEKSSLAQKIREALAAYLDGRISAQEMGLIRAEAMSTSKDWEAHDLACRIEWISWDEERGECTQLGKTNALRRLLEPPVLRWTLWGAKNGSVTTDSFVTTGGNLWETQSGKDCWIRGLASPCPSEETPTETLLQVDPYPEKK